MMYWNGHMTAGGWVLAILWTVIVLGLLVVGVYWLRRAISADRQLRPEGGTEPSAREILDRRLASGQIGVEEHARLKAAIDDRADPATHAPAARAGASG